MKYPLSRKNKKKFQWDDPGCPPEVAPLKAKPTAARGVGLISTGMIQWWDITLLGVQQKMQKTVSHTSLHTQARLSDEFLAPQTKRAKYFPQTP
jgi:hypothetical protein